MFKKFSILLGLASFFFYLLSLMFMMNSKVFMLEYVLFGFNSFEIVVILFLDWMTFLFSSFVSFISSMVLFYSEGYMEDETNKNRFCWLVVLFVFSMVMMIVSPNLISILLGWDGLGLVSYCLVIYYQNIKSFNAGMLTVLTNRIGDVALLMSIAWMLNFGSWNYLNFMEISGLEMNIIGILVILAAWTKSAQIPFCSWLPAAMAAPTPVSALVHSSTLVTAGVYLLIRFNLVLTLEMKFLSLFFSLFTMFMSGLSANFEFDLKKIIALSTLSQLGLMMSILLIGDSDLAFFHLLIHALFKALLFMCAGNFIHLFSGFQDIRFMGNLTLMMPLTSSMFNISNLSLCGLPFLSGFYSKDLILEFMSMNYLNFFVYVIFYLSIGLTVIYSIRLSFYSLFGDFNFLTMNSLKEEEGPMLKGMMGLIFLVVISGAMLTWVIFPVPYFICLPFFMKGITLLMIMLGIFLGLLIYQFKLSYDILMKKYYKFSLFNGLMWNLIFLSTFSLNYYPTYSGNFFVKILDSGWVEEFGPKKMELVSKLSKFFQVLFNNYIKMYFLLMLFWLIFIYFL